MSRALGVCLAGLLAAGGGGELVRTALAAGQRGGGVSSQTCAGADLLPSAATPAGAQAAVLCLINRARAGAGAGALSENALLDTTARRHSEDMVARNYFSESTPAGVTPLQRMAQAGVSAAVGETIGLGQGAAGSPSAAVGRWLANPAARAILLAPRASQVGIGLAAGVPASSVGPAGGAGVTYSADYAGGAGAQFGRTVGARVVSGTVTVTGPTGVTSTLSGTQTLPLGSTIDATKGRVRVSVATPGAAAATRGAHAAAAGQSADFYDGAFVVSQQRTLPYTRVTLAKGDFSSCNSASRASAGKSASPASTAARATPRRAVRRVWGNGRGSFKSAGRYAAATVRGTIWLTVDYCNGTLIRVRRGVVSVSDRVHHRTVSVRAGSQYFAASGP